MTKHVWQIKDRNSNLWILDSSQGSFYLVEQEDAHVYMSEKSVKKAIRDVYRSAERRKEWQKAWKKDPKNWGGGGRSDPFPGWEFRNDITGKSVYYKEVDLVPERYRLVIDEG